MPESEKPWSCAQASGSAFFALPQILTTFLDSPRYSQELLQDVARYVDHTLACFALRRSVRVSTVRDDYDARQRLEERWQNL